MIGNSLFYLAHLRFVWIVYHKHVTAGGQDAEHSYMLLSETNAESTIQSWGNTAPTADNFYVAGAGGD